MASTKKSNASVELYDKLSKTLGTRTKIPKSTFDRARKSDLELLCRERGLNVEEPGRRNLKQHYIEALKGWVRIIYYSKVHR